MGFAFLGLSFKDGKNLGLFALGRPLLGFACAYVAETVLSRARTAGSAAAATTIPLPLLAAGTR